MLNTTTHTLPAYWVSYMINGDPTGLSPDDIKQCDAYCEANDIGWAVDCINLTDFAASNDANNIGGATYDYICTGRTAPQHVPPPAPSVQMKVPSVQISGAGRKLLRTEITQRQAHLPKLPVGVEPDVSNAATHRWVTTRLSKRLLKIKAVALGIDLTQYSPDAAKARAVLVVTEEPEPKPVTPKPAPVTPKPKPKLKPTAPAAGAPNVPGVTSVPASTAFGMRHKALKGIMVDVFPVGHCDHVPAVDPTMYMGYDDGQLLADILLTLNRAGSLGDAERYLSNLWIAGQRGTGKSCMVKQIAAVLRRPLHVIKIRPTTTVSDLLGDFDVRSVGQGTGAPLWVDGTLTKAVKEAHSIVVLDEYSRGTQLGVSLNGPLQDRCLQITELGLDIPFAEGVNMIVTDNSVGVIDESGVFDGHDMDVSQIERWPTQVTVDYLPRDKEVSVLMSKVKGLPKHLAESMVDVAGCARKAARSSQGDPRFCPSLRLLTSWAMGVLEGRDVVRSYQQTMLIGLPDDTAEAGMVILKDQFHSKLLEKPMVDPSTPES